MPLFWRYLKLLLTRCRRGVHTKSELDSFSCFNRKPTCDRPTNTDRETDRQTDTGQWLPVRQRIRFKTTVLVFKCLHGLAPYLSEYCKLTTGRSHLRSANACLLSVPHTRTTYGDRSFAVSGPVAWNSLPVALRSSDVREETFRRHLKTFLFNCLDN